MAGEAAEKTAAAAIKHDHSRKVKCGYNPKPPAKFFTGMKLSRIPIKLAAPFARALLAFAWRITFMLTCIALLAVASLRWVEPPTSAVIARENKNIAAHNPGAPQLRFRWRDFEKISRHMAVAAIAAEDQRFPDHYGLDFVELSASLSARQGRLRGASTITQQVAKNLFLWRERSYLRKILEAPLALFIDRAWGKRRVLEMYLNIVQFGPELYGVENASRHFFGKPASRLTRRESARLASVLPNPEARSPHGRGEEMLRRQRRILQQMRAIGGAGVLRAMR